MSIIRQDYINFRLQCLKLYNDVQIISVKNRY